MGREAMCTARLATKGAKASTSAKNAAISAGKALLETTELVFRGDFRVVVPFREITQIDADASNLTVTFAGGTLVLQLGPDASKWAARIRNPPSRLDKLGVKATSLVAVVGGTSLHDDPAWGEFLRELKGRAAKVLMAPITKSIKVGDDVDIVFLAVERQADLTVLGQIKRSMRADAAIWILRPKGGDGGAVTEREVRASTKSAGLVDVKVAAFSATLTAEKVVIPVADRPDPHPARRRSGLSHRNGRG
jgi:hypothetical protein